MHVALVGVVAPELENHSLAVLGEALDAAGFDHTVIPFEGFAGMARMLDAVGAARPRVVGVSVQTTESLLAAMTFTHLMRARGFAGRIVIGGHVAALCADEILAAPTGVDVVVELAGEQALIGLARGDDPRSLPGTITRDGRGKPAIPVAPRAYRRARLGEHLGFGTADVIASRGCDAHCSYCCVAAVSSAAERAGGPRHAASTIDAIADELAELADRGGRAFHFMDDNLLPLDPTHALGWVRGLRAALEARRVPPLAFSLQLRADVVTPDLASALAELGLARAYVGIDGYTQGQLRAIGRAAPAEAGPRAIDELSARGVLCVANALVIGPTSRFETIEREVEGLAAVRNAPVHLLPIEARPGTVYHRRASARQLIEGGPLWPVYRFEDERAFLVGQVITGLPTRLAERSVPIGLYDLAWGLGVARRLAPQADVEAAAATYASVTAAWNADQVRVLRAAIDAARNGRDAVDALIARERTYLRAHDGALLNACDRALVDVERAMSAIVRRPVRAQTRGRTLGGLAVVMGLASACHSSHPTHTDAITADTPVDVLGTCSSSSHMPDWSPAAPLSYDCTCHEQPEQLVDVMFDANGVATSFTGPNGAALPADVEACLVALLSGYCYPSLAGTTQQYATCHAWIA
jgi:anaerobic magnesium-protoporphyrin IX monomethyl ester cyclase